MSLDASTIPTPPPASPPPPPPGGGDGPGGPGGPSSGGPSEATAPRRDRPSLVERLRPQPGELTDVVFAAVLAALGVVGFRTVFAGGEELVVGLPAVVLGAAVGYGLRKVRPPILLGAALATALFVVLSGPVALRHRAAGGLLPSPSAVTGLADGVVNGWIRLLTTLPPAGRSGDLLAIPYLCGFAGACVAVVLALAYPRRAWCVLPPTLVLALSVLMGTKRPASLLLQGVVFAAVTIAWVSVREHRVRTGGETSVSRSRLAAGAALLAVSALGGVVVGPRLPGAAPEDRYVLREDVKPPFDPLTEPSPLAGYRNYTDQEVRDDRIATFSGLPLGAHVRIATMDRYSGTEWDATGDGSVLAGEYLRVGAAIPSEGLGDPATVTVELHKPDGVWVPLAGDVTSLEFLGDRAEQLDDDVRVSIETDTAAVPDELRAGDRYRFTAEFSTLPDRTVLIGAPIDERFTGGPEPEVPPEFVSRGAEWARDQPAGYAEVLAIATGLQTEGAYTDGGEEANPVSPPGHGLRRLLDFIELDQPFGNGEQFAAAHGLLAQSRGVPVRVVMGFVNEKGGERVTFTGGDIEAWIEVPVEGYGWVPIDGTPPEDQLPDPLKQPRSKTDNPEPQPPPPTTIPPPTSIPDELDPEVPEDEEKEETADEGLPGWVVVLAIVVGGPIVVLGTVALLIVAIKARRRAVRRRRGPPGRRVDRSFVELVDYARDVGAPVPARTSRHDVGVLVGTDAARDLAGRADAAAFGAVALVDEDADRAWADAEEAREELAADLSRRDRLRAAVNPTSLRRPR